ncbi:transposase [[Mycoplasma] imitans]|uniref:transposase n=1 Tax=[Mycoplasma] imitans TaxID=29560 RepID=UPI001FDF7052|nr:transposase [[Mycoplasma] imitans]
MSETCIIVSDGLKEQLKTFIQKTTHITYTLYMIRNAAKYVSYSTRSDFLRNLKKTYTAETVEKTQNTALILKKISE